MRSKRLIDDLFAAVFGLVRLAPCARLLRSVAGPATGAAHTSSMNCISCPRQRRAR